MKIKIHRTIFYYLLVCLQRFFLCFPYHFGFWFGGMLGRTVFSVLPKERERTLSHLRLAFGGEKTEAEMKKIGRSVFEHYGYMAAEFLLMDKLIADFDSYVSTSGTENLDNALRAGKGGILAVAHFGNWEIMGGYHALKGYPLTVIARKIYFEKYNRFLVNLRKKMKVETVYRDESVRAMLGVLRKNRLLGFVVDQDVDSVDGVFVNFFGRPAFTPIAPVRFAMTTGAPIIPAFIIREGIRHRVIVEPPVEMVDTGKKEEDIRENTQRWVNVQERYIRQYPHLWVWNHRRWKTIPKQENGAVSK